MSEYVYALGYADCRKILLDRLEEKAPGRIQILTGPRQVGKTTLLLEIAAGLGKRAVYAAGDEPNAALPGFWDRTWAAAESRGGGGRAVLLIDEAHHISDWARHLKGHWDRLRRLKIPLHIVISGSSSLRVGAGSRESLAGRFERVTLTHWSAGALSEVFRLPPGEAAQLLVRFGSYPGAFGLRTDPARWRAYIRDAIIEPAIGRDVFALGSVRRPAMLRQVFASAAAMPAQIVSLQKLQGLLQESGALETVAHYLKLLEDAYLVAGLEKFSMKSHRRRAAPPKLVVLNNALLSAMHPEGPPDPGREPARFGAWVENACLAYALNQGQMVSYWREEPLEIDGVIDGTWGSWALEVKTGAFDPFQLKGLFEFVSRYPRYKPLVVAAPGEEQAARRLGLAAVSWVDFLHFDEDQAKRLHE